MLRRMLFLASVAGLVLSACGNANSTPASNTPGAGRTAELSELRNTVETRAGEAAQWAAATEGQALAEGSAVRTGEDSRVRVDLSDSTILRLAPNTEFALAQLTPEATDPVTQWSLTVGHVWISVTKALGGGAFEVNTPNGVATVRGSLMGVEYHPGNGHMIITCLEGACRLTQPTTGQFTDLTAGQQTGIRGFGNNPLPARTIDIVRLTEWSQIFPEAQSVVTTITPGPAPTSTPIP